MEVSIKKKNIRVHLRDKPDLNGTLMFVTDIISEFEKILGDVPEEHRDKVIYDISSDYDCGIECDMYYDRLETDEEACTRVERKRKRNAELEMEQHRRDMRKLKELNEKYRLNIRPNI